MKRITKLFIVLMISIICASIFTACGLLDNLEINGTGTSDVSADTKKDCLELVDGYFKDTLKNPNFVVTVKRNDALLFTENIVNTDGFYVEGNTKVYSYKKNNFFYNAVETSEEVDGATVYNRSYITNDTADVEHYNVNAENFYNANYCNFINRFISFDRLSEDKATFKASNHTDEKDRITKDNATMTTSSKFNFEYDSTETKITLTSTAKDYKIEEITIVTIDKTNSNAKTTVTMTFTYGSAKVTIPDTTGWGTAN